MADLDPRVLEQIERGPMPTIIAASLVDGEHTISHTAGESHEDFATRIATLAVECERERAAKLVESHDEVMDGHGNRRLLPKSSTNVNGCAYAAAIRKGTK